jgi:hypothetical protein
MCSGDFPAEKIPTTEYFFHMYGPDYPKITFLKEMHFFRARKTLQVLISPGTQKDR